MTGLNPVHEIKNIKLEVIPAPAFQLLDIFIGGDGLLAAEDLGVVQLPAPYDFSKPTIINGKAPIWLYAHLVHLLHPSPWVAVMDPRLGGVVVQVHIPNSYSVGSVIPLSDIHPYLPGHPAQKKSPRPAGHNGAMCVALVGPPNSGKSVLLAALRRQLRSGTTEAWFQRSVFSVYACPDGEGDWFNESEEGTLFRIKRGWGPEFVDTVCKNIAAMRNQKELILVDCGGIIDKYNQKILNACTHAIIVSSNPEKTAEWRGAIKTSELTVLYEVASQLTPGFAKTGEGTYTFGVLDRNTPVALPPEFLAPLTKQGGV